MVIKICNNNKTTINNNKNRQFVIHKSLIQSRLVQEE